MTETLIFIGKNEFQIDIIKGYQLIKNESEEEIRRAFKLGEEGVTNTFNKAKWEFYPDGKFLFIPNQEIRDIGENISGSYKINDTLLQFHGERKFSTNSRTCIDGIINLTENSLQLMYISSSAVLGEQIARISQQLLNTPSIPEENSIEVQGIKIPSTYKVVVNGIVDSASFTDLEGIIKLSPKSLDDLSSLYAVINIGLPGQVNSFFWRSCAHLEERIENQFSKFQVVDKQISIDLGAKNPDPIAGWYTKSQSKLSFNMDIGSLISSGVISMFVEGDTISGKICAEGTTFFGEPSHYQADFTGCKQQNDVSEDLSSLFPETNKMEYFKYPSNFTGFEGIELPISFEISLTGQTELQAFGSLLGELSLYPSTNELTPFELYLSVHSRMENGSISWSTPGLIISSDLSSNCKIEVKNKHILLTIVEEEIVKDINWWSQCQEDPNSSTYANAKKGFLSFSIKENELFGEISIEGVSMGSYELQKCKYQATITGQKKESIAVNKIREKVEKLNLSSSWITTSSEFGQIDFLQNDESLVGVYKGKFQGKIEGFYREEQIHFSWWNNEQSQGSGFLRLLPSNGNFVGYWLDGNNLHSLIVKQQSKQEVIEQNLSIKDILELKYLAKELYAEGKYQQALELFENLLPLYDLKESKEESWFDKRNRLVDEADILNNLISCSFNLANYDLLLKYLEQSLLIRLQLNPQNTYRGGFIDCAKDLHNTITSRVSAIDSLLKQLLKMQEQINKLEISFDTDEEPKALVNDSFQTLIESDISKREALYLLTLKYLINYLETLKTRLNTNLNFLINLEQQVLKLEKSIIESIINFVEYIKQEWSKIDQEVQQFLLLIKKLFPEEDKLQQMLACLVTTIEKSNSNLEQTTEDIKSGRLEAELFSSIKSNLQLNNLEKNLILFFVKLFPLVMSFASNVELDCQFLIKTNKEASFEERTKKAQENFLTLSLWLENWRKKLITDLDKITALEKSQSFFQKLITILIDLGGDKEALTISEQARAKAFVDLLSTTPNHQALTGDLSEYNLPSVAVTPSVKIDEIMEFSYSSKTTLVEYFITDDKMFIWVVSPNKKICFKQQDTKQLELQQSISNFLYAIEEDKLHKARNLILIGKKRLLTKDILRKLHQLLIEPIVHLLPNNPEEHVVFIPQSSLFLVPFPALLDINGKYLVEKHTILTSPSIQVLIVIHKRPKNNQKVTESEILVVGNPKNPAKHRLLPNLEGAEEEALTVASLLNTKAIIGKQAIKSVIVEKMLSARWVHLATHGHFDEENGLKSGVMLSASNHQDLNDENWLLTAEEILKLKLDIDTVVLSACNTGLGKVTGDGVLGLSRAFIAAGAQSILVSLWSIPDSPTALLMKAFYCKLPSNINKASALREAMLEIMKVKSDPKDWAAFTLIGKAN